MENIEQLYIKMAHFHMHHFLGHGLYVQFIHCRWNINELCLLRTVVLKGPSEEMSGVPIQRNGDTLYMS